MMVYQKLTNKYIPAFLFFETFNVDECFDNSICSAVDRLTQSKQDMGRRMPTPQS